MVRDFRDDNHLVKVFYAGQVAFTEDIVDKHYGGIHGSVEVGQNCISDLTRGHLSLVDLLLMDLKHLSPFSEGVLNCKHI
jgi:hypothetical protein